MHPTERRTDPKRRAIFDEAYVRIEPFLDPSRTWGRAALTGLAYRVLRQAYPDLSAQDAHVLINAARRVYLIRRAQGEATHARSTEALASHA